MLTFKETNSFQKRLRMVENCKLKHSEKIPVVIELGKGETRLNPPDSSGKVFSGLENYATAPRSWTMVDLAAAIRSELKDDKTLFFLVGGKNIPLTASSTFEQLHEQYKDEEDGFLYVNYYGVTVNDLF